MTRSKHIDGFTLPELMVSLVIGTTIMLAVSILFASSNKAQNEVRKSSQQLENAFIGNALLSEQIRLAGFYGEFDPINMAEPGALPDVCDITASMKLHVQGLNDVTAATKPACITESIVENSDILVVRRVGTCTAGDADCADTVIDGNTYLQVSRCNQDTTAYYVAAAPFAFDLHQNCPSTVALASIAAAPLRRYRVQIYYVAANNQPSDGIPTLKRLELTGAAASTTIGLATGIGEMQVQYGVDSAATNDGNADSFVPEPATIADWTQVVAVKVWLLGRNLEESPDYINGKSYVLGDVVRGPFNDRYKREVLTSEVRLTNVAARKE